MVVSFSDSEEAFLYKNIRNIVQVWSGGHGQARLNLFVKNGVAEVQLTYQLGHPEESHLPYQQQAQTKLYDQRYYQKQQRQKSEKRRSRDNLRAAKFQFAGSVNRPGSIVPSTTSSTSINAVPASTISSPHISSTIPAVSNTTVGTPVVSSYFTTSQVSLSTTTTTTPSFITTIPSTLQSIPPSTSPAVVIPVSATSIPNPTVPATTVDHRQEQFTMESMPQQDGYCCGCDLPFNFPCYASPCLVCGAWFHEECFDNHTCSEFGSDDDEIGT